MYFEFNSQKSASNLQKHSIDFIRAQKLWQDEQMLMISAKSSSEKRFMVIGKIGEKHWSCIMTYRGSVIRIISVRRSRKEEVKLYESE